MLGLGYLVGNFQRGKLERQKDETTVKQSVFDLLQKEVTELEDMVAKDEKEMAVMKIQIEEKERKVREFMEILQNRNPEIVNYMATSYSYMKDSSLYMTEAKDLLKTIVANTRELKELHEANSK